MKLAVTIAVVGLGCGSQSSTPDAGHDGPSPAVLTVDCATATPVTTVTATTTMPYTYNFAPTATISVGDVVKFQMPGLHNVTPFGTMTDSGLTVGFGQTKCLKFTVRGTFNFRCTAHPSLRGAITAN